jgi:SAM-dependent methyltransferase
MSTVGAIARAILGPAVAALRHPRTVGLDVDAPESVLVHRDVILSKPLLRQVYAHWYGECLAAVAATTHLDLPMIELGCGASHVERYVPGVIKTDVVPQPNARIATDAEHLPFGDGGLRAIFMVGVFHHVPQPARFLAEADRALAPGGRLVMLEPTNGVLHRLMIRLFHPYEHFDGSVTEWTNPTTGRLSSANNALPWIVFERDRDRLAREFPRLRVRSIRRHTAIAYYLSGGLSYRAFLPAGLSPLVQFVDRAAARGGHGSGSMMTIDVERLG